MCMLYTRKTLSVEEKRRRAGMYVKTKAFLPAQKKQQHNVLYVSKQQQKKNQYPGRGGGDYDAKCIQQLFPDRMPN